MAKLAAYNRFSDTGWPAPCLVSRSTTGGHMVGNYTDPGKHLMVLGIITEGPVDLRATPDGTNAGDVILTLEGGDTDYSAQFNFPGAVDFGDGKGIYANMTGSDTNITIFYIVQITS